MFNFDFDYGTWQQVCDADRWWSAEADDRGCLTKLREMPDNSVDMVLTSPPYEKKRKYGKLDFKLKGQDWVDWAREIYLECHRVCRGLVAWVVEGTTKNFQWSATPALLMTDLHRSGVKLRKPPAYYRRGGPGSGGSDWWANTYEFVICSSKGKLPWNDRLAYGTPPVWPRGGKISQRKTNDVRTRTKKHYKVPPLSDPGNVIHVKVGGGIMGDRLCHDNEAPFAESFAERMIASFCAPGAIVLDPFVGSGTTPAMALKLMRRSISFEMRKSQIEICGFRIPKLLTLQHQTALERIKHGQPIDCPRKGLIVPGASLPEAGDCGGDTPPPGEEGEDTDRGGETPAVPEAGDRGVRGGQRNAGRDFLLSLFDAPDSGATAALEHHHGGHPEAVTDLATAGG